MSDQPPDADSSTGSGQRDPDPERVQERARERQSSRAESTEDVLETVETHLGDLEYPVSSEEIAAEYGSEPIDLPNETETMGSVLDRLAGETYDTPEEAREAIFGQLTGEAGGRTEANPERDLESLDEAEQGSASESGGSSL
ncbi:hypothetical protein ACFQO4_04920 [Saliphagus sp. GCM10025334]